MKVMLPVLVTCVIALSVSQATASVFAGSGGAQLQSVVTPSAYEYIDVADYQTRINNTLMGAVEVSLAPTPEIVGDLGRTRAPQMGNGLILGAASSQELPGGEPVQVLFGSPVKIGSDGPQTTWWGTRHHHRHRWRRRGVTPAPEPATWILLAAGLATAGLFVSKRWENGAA